jgi:hypothetical protein
MRIPACVLLAGAVTFAATAWGQVNQREPHVGYAYPAGGRQGTTVEVLVGGQLLRGANEAYVTGQGVHASVVQYYRNPRMLKADQRLELIKQLEAAKARRMAELGLTQNVPLFPGEAVILQQAKAAARRAAEAAKPGNEAKPAANVKPTAAADKTDAAPEMQAPATPEQPPAQTPPVELPDSPLLRNLDGMSLRQLMAVADEFLSFQVSSRREVNPQLVDTVLLRVTIDPDAAPGDRELRLATPLGLTNPICFQVGTLPEVLEQEPDDPGRTAMLPPEPPVKLPVVLNGQILPGDVDRFHFDATKGQHLVIETYARQLIPFLADAVPGWFQPAITLYDQHGKEVAFADHYLFHPDPVIFYDVPQDGTYELEVRDTIYRGREDFVYRIAIGELPFITAAFPLGGRTGSDTDAAIEGWNLSSEELPLDTSPGGPGVRQAVLRVDTGIANEVTYAVDDLPECVEAEPNDDALAAQQVALPMVVNGRISKPGDVDVFQFQGHAGDEVVADVTARRLGSPLDSLVRVSDSAARVLAWNDDYMPTDGYLHPDMGVITHQADSYLSLKLPADGTYYVFLSDAQGHGGPDYAYRLRISAPRPDFALLMAPSSLLLRAGSSATATVHVLRRDGFAGEVDLALKDAPDGLGLKGGKVPAGKDSADVEVTAGPRVAPGPVEVQLEGHAQVDGQTISRPVVPAQDEMQAFLWRHLVPSQELVAFVRPRPGPGRGLLRGAGNGRGAGARLPAGLKSPATVQVPAGGAGQVRVDIPGVMRFGRALHLELQDPPEGVSIGEVSVVPGGVTFQVKAEGKAAQAGYKADLKVAAFLQRPGGAGGRVALGTLPAVPIEVVAP